MKVRITLTVDIDPEAWALEYGTAPGQVREDVKRYCEGTVVEQLGLVGVLASQTEALR